MTRLPHLTATVLLKRLDAQRVLRHSIRHRLCSLNLVFLVVRFCPFVGRGEMGSVPARREALRASASTPVALRVYGSSKNQHNEIFGASSKSSPWPREQGPT